jgi:hypothetical protein
MDSNFQFRTDRERFRVLAELGPVDRRRGGIIRAVVGLGNLQPQCLLWQKRQNSFSMWIVG